jgi:predicted dehydrogenase
MSEMAFPLRFAVIGCGRIAKNYLAPLSGLPGGQLKAMCDLNRDSIWQDAYIG